jgi:hypothetical protein
VSLLNVVRPIDKMLVGCFRVFSLCFRCVEWVWRVFLLLIREFGVVFLLFVVFVSRYVDNLLVSLVSWFCLGFSWWSTRYASNYSWSS